MRSPTFLVADVGGTNTRVALTAGDAVQPETIRKYRNVEFENLAPVLRQYRADQGGEAPLGACVAVAGPVTDDRVTLTNLNWSIDLPGLRAATGARFGAILNDLQAQGHALGHLPETSLTPVLPAVQRRSKATRLVIGVGTGFNAAPVYDTPRGRLVPASEAGHANLPLRDAKDLRLGQFVGADHGFAAIEDVLSGPGLARVYGWLAVEAGHPDTCSAADVMARLDTDARAREALQIFAGLLGVVAGNLALVHLPFGGLYLTGGVARSVGMHLQRSGFADAFRDKGRFTDFMGDFPVYLVVDDYAALIGCAAYLHEMGLSRDQASYS